MCSGRARRARCRVWASGSEPDRNLARRKIDDAGGDKEWRYFPRPALEKCLMLAFDDRKSADAGTDEYACALCQLGANGQTRLFHRAICGSDRVMDERVHFLNIFLVEPSEGIKVFDLGGNLCGKLRGIKTGNSRDPAASFA